MTNTSVPAVDRTVAVIAFLAEHQPQRFTLSELCREVDLPKATAHSLLSSLCDHGWLWRDPDAKTYGLGAGLVTLADVVAAQPRTLVQAARAEMEQLAGTTGVRVVATNIVGDDIVMLAVAGAERPFGAAVHPGQRLALAPPLGTVFLAWSEPARVERWLRHLGTDATDADRQRYRDAVAVVRRRGYSVALESPARRLLGQALDDDDHPPSSLVTELDRGEYVLYDLEPDHEYRVSMIAAPVFDERRTATMAVSLFDLPETISATTVVSLAEQLQATADAITKHLGGTAPTSH